MTRFDPEVATATYLATLSPEAHARATAYTQGGHWLILWTAVIGLAAYWLILRSGMLVRLRERLEARGLGPVRISLAVLATALFAETLLNLPWVIWSDWARERAYGLSSQPLAGFLRDYALYTVIILVSSTLLGACIYALIRRAPRFWWAWSGGLVSLFFVLSMVVSPVFIDPLFNRYEPAPSGPVRDAVVALAKANGVPSDRIFIYDGSRQSNRYTANVSGLFGGARIAMSDVMFKKDADIAEVRAVVGHEMGHYVLGHVWRNLIFFSALAFVCFFLIDRLFPTAVRLLSGQGVKGLSDPAGYPVLGALIVVLGVVGNPLAASFSRWAEVESDRFSLERAREPDGLARALVKTIEYRAATPGRLEETLFYTHPSVGSRVRMAMEWKAAQQAEPMPVTLVRPDPVPQ
ncbi:M48 family metallopeptidase [Phenylobacterium sp.]|jgi:STE24 endopeptidase|uniref:M48 family metallopeptidase n=1 Tax=Phenylobacterium sp. TaxID=1871053 RepID=UPI0025F00527|nr:M48 family metallopeptidase [Phenylobacterium sp.]MCA6287513.1 M48 family metallopeptidase [Phenylobacterium sp.]MCA6311756.1 M48 family metallopeptidase [Phenylobacterium sp.]MCA6324893.1 M48 family metallopeptidase [Phenylobacterium sp.]MCA6338533.1 M48 family metallopeptidase [Phenylobacterium sp.]MCA6341284.1 M48 family metallopeptidase [Phenylobacterium sp.]